MKRYLPLAALLLLALASASFAQPTPAASPSASPKPAMSKAQIRGRMIATEKIITTEKEVWEALKNKDVKLFEANLSADSVMIGYIGVLGKTDAVKLIANMPCETKSYTLTDFKVTFFNSGTALLTYKGATEGTCLGRAVPTVWASAIYVKRGGQWLKASHQETPTK